ncbi:flagellar biosynthetic protein FliQ [Candidatus Sodalis endolongispinus]|uniref:Flagellar biosynthetic protein FliQ n=1 Tax=Candidatus Sodalis endolongispinus TaxID=2812662 RepID=A0ABS5YB78_9GAMM|nr:flagellar biosynthetic protein FliQ [Candidatus Sodalis endolongispinus]MBT9432256.1 flagellar biosynthetic protein FliQ [Candidatus Sodalis endolongispinus]
MSEIAYIGNSALLLVLKLSAVPIAMATIVWLVVWLFQTVMQIQEQTLPFGLKMLAVFACLLMLMGWFANDGLRFATESFLMGFR